ncbi:MAG TPA: hypothetical protein VNL77_12775 [Roseiflexaceae bacterium]|nr:hypothetical protein [Roseiflexaceae bacterium]
MRRTSCLLILALLGVLAAALPARAEPQQPRTIGFFGLNTYLTGLERIANDGEDGIAALTAQGRAAGAAWAREELSWANIEPGRKGRWNFGYMDRRIGQLAQSGYGIVGMLLTTPEWARVADCKGRAQQGRTQEYWCPPASPRDFADFAWTIAERYDGDGTFDAPGSPRVAAWQIWNEPSAPLTWPGTPAEYGAMLVAAYKAIKAADQGALVTLGGVYLFDGLGTDATDGLPFYSRMIAAVPEALHTWDALPIHPYMTSAAPDAPGIHATITVWGRILTAQRWLREHPGIHGVRPLWISELGWTTCRCGQADCPPTSVRDEGTAASYMVRAHAVALALGVQHLSHFQLEDKFDGAWGHPCEDAAALLAPKAEGYRQKAAFLAYRTMTEQLAGASFAGFGRLHRYRFNPRDQNYAGLYHLRFSAPGGGWVDVLWRTVGSQAVELPREPRTQAEVVALDGSRTPVGGPRIALTVGEAPMYVRQTPGRGR